VSLLIVKGGIRCTLVVCSIKSGCESHSWFGNLGRLVCGLLVTAFVKMSTQPVIVIPGMRASLSTCAPQMVHLQTVCNHQNQGGLKSQCGHYPGKRRVRGRDGVVCGVAWDWDS